MVVTEPAADGDGEGGTSCEATRTQRRAERTRKRVPAAFDAAADAGLSQRFLVLQRLGPTTFLLQEAENIVIGGGGSATSVSGEGDDSGDIAGEDDEEGRVVWDSRAASNSGEIFDPRCFPCADGTSGCTVETGASQISNTTKKSASSSKGDERGQQRRSKAGSTKKFKVSLGSPFHHCSCNTGESTTTIEKDSTRWCVHICFVLLKVLRVERDFPVVHRGRITEADLDQLLTYRERLKERQWAAEQRAKRREEAAARLHARGGGDRDGAGGGDGNLAGGKHGSSKYRPPAEDEQCPICFDDLLGDGDSRSNPYALIYCEEGCKRAIHTSCMLKWCEHHSSSGATCPLCRVPWSGEQVQTLQKRQLKNVRAQRKDAHTGLSCRFCRVRPIRGPMYACLNSNGLPSAGGTNPRKLTEVDAIQLRGAPASSSSGLASRPLRHGALGILANQGPRPSNNGPSSNKTSDVLLDSAFILVTYCEECFYNPAARVYSSHADGSVVARLFVRKQAADSAELEFVPNPSQVPTDPARVMQEQQFHFEFGSRGYAASVREQQAALANVLSSNTAYQDVNDLPLSVLLSLGSDVAQELGGFRPLNPGPTSSGTISDGLVPGNGIGGDSTSSNSSALAEFGTKVDTVHEAIAAVLQVMCSAADQREQTRLKARSGMQIQGNKAAIGRNGAIGSQTTEACEKLCVVCNAPGNLEDSSHAETSSSSTKASSASLLRLFCGHACHAACLRACSSYKCPACGTYLLPALQVLMDGKKSKPDPGIAGALDNGLADGSSAPCDALGGLVAIGTSAGNAAPSHEQVRNALLPHQPFISDRRSGQPATALEDSLSATGISVGVRNECARNDAMPNQSSVGASRPPVARRTREENHRVRRLASQDAPSRSRATTNTEDSTTVAPLPDFSTVSVSGSNFSGLHTEPEPMDLYPSLPDEKVVMSCHSSKSKIAATGTRRSSFSANTNRRKSSFPAISSGTIAKPPSDDMSGDLSVGGMRLDTEDAELGCNTSAENVEIMGSKFGSKRVPRRIRGSSSVNTETQRDPLPAAPSTISSSSISNRTTAGDNSLTVSSVGMTGLCSSSKTPSSTGAAANPRGEKRLAPSRLRTRPRVGTSETAMLDKDHLASLALIGGPVFNGP
ncbi:unnamed protein product [Amoebophrya sp. A25]|nr:unnamed protein product [Amoebophrya sp. A25]|eukprot:GSA25T00024694001.1